MFDNIGEKTKGMAKAMFAIGVVSSLIAGGLVIAINYESFQLWGAGIAIIVIGSLLAYNGCVMTVALGQVVQNTDILAGRCALKESPSGEKRIIGDTPTEKTHTTTGTCQLCSANDVNLYDVKIVDEMGTRYRKVCLECMKKNNCKLVG